MPIALVKSVNAQVSAGGSVSAVLNGVAAGNKLVLFAASWQGDPNFPATGTVTSTPAATWNNDSGSSALTNDVNSVGGVNSAVLYSADAVTAGNTSVTCTWGGTQSYSQVALAEFSGVLAGTAARDQVASGQGRNGTPATNTSGATTQEESLVVALLSASANAVGAVGIDPATPGYTRIGFDDDPGTIVAYSADYKVVSAAGPQSCAWGTTTVPNQFHWSACLCAYKAAAAPPPVVAPKTVTLTNGTSWVVPVDWNSADNSIELRGGGGSGGNNTNATTTTGAGGGGGAYARINNFAATPGASIPVQIGAGGAGRTTAGVGSAGTASWFSSTTTALAAPGSGGGSGTTSATGGAGGTVAASVGTTRFAGGAGGNTTVAGAASGGGASAGTAANGPTATNVTTAAAGAGATATAGGGGANGGAGSRTTTSAAAGAIPGGGGGGHVSTTGGSGAGGAGRIVITYRPLLVRKKEAQWFWID